MRLDLALLGDINVVLPFFFYFMDKFMDLIEFYDWYCKGELKRLLSQLVGLEPEEQRLLFRGKEKDNEERMHMAGVKDMSKLVLLEDPASRERKLEEMKKNERIARACEAVVRIRSEVDKHVEKVCHCLAF